MKTIELYNEDCWEAIKKLGDNSVDAIITDPPYDISFMGKGWDKDSLITNVEFWKECLRVLKHGGHLLSFGHSRTSHRTATAIENAGFEIRDTIMWIYGSGFPKSHNVAIALDKKHGAMGHRGKRASFAGNNNQGGENLPNATNVEEHEPITDVAKQWEGWGTALKPAHEPVIVARKPLDGTVAHNCEKWGVGALNIDATRIAHNEDFSNLKPVHKGFAGIDGTEENNHEDEKQKEALQISIDKLKNLGRFPANIIFGHNEDCEQIGTEEEEVIGGNKGTSGFAEGYESGDFTKKTIKNAVWKCSEGCAVKHLDEQSGVIKTGVWNETDGARHFENNGKETKYKTKKKIKEPVSGASKFFYCPKVGKKERNKGATNKHPTVKPVDLMEYLIKLVTREGHIVLDPFMGSGSTGIAAKLLKRKFIGCEREKEYYEIAKARIENW
jgi:site-specific DNA-methyltransferase (adenine-specific)